MARGRPTPNSSTAPTPDFEAQVRANILTQPLGPGPGSGTVADLDLPHDFLTRLTDRVLRDSFYGRFRAVVADGGASGPSFPDSSDIAPPPPKAHSSESQGIRIEPLELESGLIKRWAWFSETPPALASFRSPLSSDSASQPGDEEDGLLRDARSLARKHLARDGLLSAAARVIVALGPERMRSTHSPVAMLMNAGIPADLLPHFRPELGSAGCTPEETVHALADRLASGESIDRLLKSLRRAGFQPVASLPGFHPTSDSGHDTIKLIRAHATRSTYYTAPGDGSNLDLLSTTLAALPNTPFLLATDAQTAEPLRESIGHVQRSGAIKVVSQPLKVSQWAGDNAKPGTLDGHPAHLAPRFASRGEYHSTFVPGDDLAVSTRQIHSARSPLLFQGGNVFIVDDLPQVRRVLLIGEAEVHRNRALGLSTEQVLSFLQVEFGTDACEVLPAASYHIDQELTIRSTPDHTLAFVPDVQAAAIVIIECALAALADSKRWPTADVQQALAHLHDSHHHEAINLIWGQLARERTPDLAYPLSLAESLSTGPADSGVGNLHRFLLAIDHLAAGVVPSSSVPDPNLAALIRAFPRRATDRAKIRTLLSRLGWRVIAVPAIPEESRGINPLNGVHTRDAYLMPSYGGLFSPLDRIAQTAFLAAFGTGVVVRPIPSGESQRRQGALHCSLALFGQ